GGGAGARDDRDGPRPRGGADVSATAGARGPAGVRAVGGPEDDRGGDLAVCPRREGDRRGALLHQQPGHGREAAGAGGPGPLGDRERLPLGPRYDVSRGRVADPRGGVAGELRLAESLHVVAVE